MNIDELFKELTKLNKNLSARDICEIWGMDETSFSRKKKDKTGIKHKNIEQLEKALDIKLAKTNQEIANINGCISITYRPDVYLSAGYGVEALEERAETMLIDACLLVSERGVKYNPDKCEVVRISGNSMSPEYRHGDRVIINKDDTELIDGHIFAFRYKNQCYVKEINLMGDRVKCISLNKEYDPFYIESNEDFKVFGRILPRIRL